MLSCSVVSDSLPTPWTAGRQAPLSMGFSGKSTGVGCLALLQRKLEREEKASEGRCGYKELLEKLGDTGWFPSFFNVVEGKIQFLQAKREWG